MIRIRRLKRLKFKQWFTLSIIVILFGVTLSLVFFALIIKDLPNPEQFETRQIIESTKIYDRSGKTILYEIHGEEKRTVLPFSEIPEFLKQATVAIEDNNFYKNPAFDWKAIIRAILVNLHLREGYAGQGGSTITQQLARNAFLTSERTLIRDIIRKIKELFVAIELEKRYNKDEILGLYLNQIPYGGNAYGVEAAAKTFFGKSAKDLTLAESALLASLPRGTSYYSPWGKHVDELLKRKNLVLERMESLGYITVQQKEGAKKAELIFADQSTGIKAPHFVLEVQDYLNKKYGEEFVQTAGLTVVTTLDWDLQQAAEKAVTDGAARNTELYNGHNASLVAQNANTGQILALVGSKDYFLPSEPENCTPGLNCQFEGNFNVATQGLRQPGSAMKPFAYLTAFQKGYTPDTVLFDVPTEFAANNEKCPLLVDFENEEKECFHPNNFDEKFRGPVTMRTALAQSINIPAVKTLYLAGIDDTLKTSHDLGITTLTERSRYGLSLVLGGGEVTLLDLVGAYSVFAQEGVKHKQTFVIKITDSKGKIVEEYKDAATQVIESQYPRILNDILTDVEERSGLFSSSLPLTLFPGHQVALKTGTTNDYHDAWAIGYTPELIVGVWAGNNNNVAMTQRGSSLLAAVPIWSAFMRDALKDKPLVSFNKPEPIVSSKPVFQGQSTVNFRIGNNSYSQIHSILFYVDKKDPQGPPPVQPENDSQFKNWEFSVLKWAEQSIPNFSAIYNYPLPQGAITDNEQINALQPTLNFISPKNGDFIQSNSVWVQARVTAPSPISKIQLFFNNELMDERSGNNSQDIMYQFNLAPKKIELQNLLQLKVTGANNTTIQKELILFK
ncbi:MAG: hypothetical protein A3H63_01240 [Candidatus Harrisonbacteria bacterium RIFCSPLOWO2_02_FULL_45_10c]|uniref:Uncharacterized protein n=1 Tax=Candidatus Harrisonbacteria bacterium RIFCSPLOWO2_02_FULL_45_10c TaxID=1798410 RepID=A0A1G1ZRE0_9BACT|nr:MAG: hypothetical protein A3H63_01240 [Candidatus Harrisonbacteria bacterium RIFCSPLOWO2_02_FULL_45_10c]